MLSVDRIREIAKEMARPKQYCGFFSCSIEPKPAEDTEAQVYPFRETVEITHKQLLTASEDAVMVALRPALTKLVHRTRDAFRECSEVEFIGESMYGADVQVRNYNNVCVLFYSYSAGIKVVRQRVTEEKV
jgi:hypothetical protein